MKKAPRTEAEAVEQFLPFVVLTAKGYVHPDVSFDDLVQEGLLAVALAFRVWDPQGGANILTWIRRPVRAAVLKEAKRQKKKGALYRKAGEITPWRVTHESMDVTLPPSNPEDVYSYTPHDVIGEPDPEIDSLAVDQLPHLFSILTPREKEVMELRYYQDMTFHEVGRRLRLSHTMIENIEKEALRRMKKAARK